MTTHDPDALREGITWLRAHYDTPDVLAVCDAAARAADAERERDEYRALWKSRSDIRAYDKVCAERDEAREVLAGIERLLRAGWALENIGDTFWFSSPAFSPTRRAPTLPDAVRAAVAELEETK